MPGNSSASIGSASILTSSAISRRDDFLALKRVERTVGEDEAASRSHQRDRARQHAVLQFGQLVDVVRRLRPCHVRMPPDRARRGTGRVEQNGVERFSAGRGRTVGDLDFGLEPSRFEIGSEAGSRDWPISRPPSPGRPARQAEPSCRRAPRTDRPRASQRRRPAGAPAGWRPRPGPTMRPLRSPGSSKRIRPRRGPSRWAARCRPAVRPSHPRIGLDGDNRSAFLGDVHVQDGCRCARRHRPLPAVDEPVRRVSVSRQSGRQGRSLRRAISRSTPFTSPESAPCADRPGMADRQIDGRAVWHVEEQDLRGPDMQDDGQAHAPWPAAAAPAGRDQRLDRAPKPQRGVEDRAHQQPVAFARAPDRRDCRPSSSVSPSSGACGRRRPPAAWRPPCGPAARPLPAAGLRPVRLSSASPPCRPGLPHDQGPGVRMNCAPQGPAPEASAAWR
jgi:hypothetical protein